MTGQEIVDRWRQQALNMGWITGDAPPGAFAVLAGMIDDALNDLRREREAIEQESRGR